MENDPIFTPLEFPNLKVKNRIFRSSISGRFDNYDGSGSYARLNWEEKFARGGVGAIITSFVPVAIRGRILPNYATIHSDDNIPFWRKIVERVHEYDCRFLIQLSHSGRQQDVGGIENIFRKPLSSTSRTESFHGFLCEAMTKQDIADTVAAFAEGARRARDAGADGVELHSANGYLITQFLSSGINDRTDEYGGSVENRARILTEIIQAIRKKVGADFHLQFKISARDYNNALFPWEKKGNFVPDSIEIAKLAVAAGADAVHVSTGSMFPHPRNPAGDFPLDEAARWYPVMLPSGIKTHRNYKFFRSQLLGKIFKLLWGRTQSANPEAANAEDAFQIKQNVAVPVICTGGFQTASVIRDLLKRGYLDAVAIARPLIANNDLPKIWESGVDRAPKPCTYCNRCLLNVLQNPLGCYDVTRYDGDHDKMVAEVLSVYHPRLDWTSVKP